MSGTGYVGDKERPYRQTRRVAREHVPELPRTWTETWKLIKGFLKSEVGRNARGTTGLADTLAALNERKVQVLLVQEGFRAPGFASPNADFLAVEGGRSPRGEELQKRDDVVESAIESALEQSAEVIVVHHHPDLEALGSIGAVLRY